MYIKNAIILLSLMLQFGCSGMSFDPNDSSKWLAKYYSNPSGAKIYVDDKYVGTTPVSFSYPSIGISSKKVIAKFPQGKEQAVKSGFYTFEIHFDFINNKATIKEYPTAFSVAARTREVTFEKSISKSLMAAVINNDTPAVKKFIDSDKGTVKRKSENGITPLFVAVETNKPKIVDMLLKKGASPDVQSPDGRFPLIIATVKQNQEIVSMLLDHGADPNKTNKHEVSALIFAAGNSNIEILENLISHGANLNQKSEIGHTPLMTAVLSNQIGIVKVLVDKGADMNIVETKYGTTPVLQAALKKHYDMVEYLVKNGADKNIPDYKGITLHQQAIITNDNRLLEISRFNKEFVTLQKIEEEFDKESKKYTQQKSDYLKFKSEYKGKELSFLEKLSDKQLELYSKYIENVNGSKNLAKILLSFRKFSASLDDGRKNEFVILYSEKQKEKSGSDLLVKMEDNLRERKQIITDVKKHIDEIDSETAIKDQKAVEIIRSKQRTIVARQQAMANQKAQNVDTMLSLFATGLNSYNEIQAKKYDAQSAAFNNFNNQYESDMRNRDLIKSINGIENTIRRGNMGLY